MAGKLLKENIPMEHAIGQGAAQASAETSAMLTGGDRNVAIVSARALPVIGTTEVQTGGVAVQGTVECLALYLTDTGELRSRSAQTGFTAVIPIEDAAPKMRARVLITVCSVETSEKDGRLDFAVEMRLEGFVSQLSSEAVATAVQSPSRIEQRTAVLATLNPMVRAQVRESFAENFPLDDEAYTRVVTFDAHTQIDSVQVQDGAVEVAGSVTVDSLLAGADAAAPVGWQTETLPFAVEIEDEGFRADMQVSVTSRLRDVQSEVVFNFDGEEEEGNLHIEYVLELIAEGQASIVTEVLADAYPLSDEPFTAQQAVLSYVNRDERVTQRQTLIADIELPSDQPAMSALIGAFAAPVAMDTLGDNIAHAEGLVRITLLYRTPDSEGLTSYAHEAPFALDFDQISGLAQVSSVEVERVTAERLSSTQVQAQVVLAFRAEEIGTADTQVLAEISEEGEPVVLPVGAVLYYPDRNETLWDVARRYRTSAEELQKRNPEGKSPVLIYRRLTEF